MTSKSVEIFFSYSHKDERFREQLEKHLSMLKRNGLIKPWHDRMITAGDEWQVQIDDNLNAADIVLLLVSANFFASDYCYEIEMKRAMKRHERGEARVVPIILTPVEGWKDSPFAKLQVLPTGGNPVTKWDNREDAYVNVVQGIRKAVMELGIRKALKYVPTESIEDAYKKYFPPTYEWNLEANNIEEKLQNLKNIRKLSDFLQILIQDENVPEETRKQFSDATEKLKRIDNSYYHEEHKSAIDNYPKEQGKLESKSYLLVIFQPHNNDIYYLSAWLIDESLPSDNPGKTNLISIKEGEPGIPCKLNTIEESLDKLINKALAHKNQKNTLIIDFFLPKELLYSTKFEWSDITGVGERKIPIGIQYEVRLRSIERLTESYKKSYFSRWKDKWEKVKEVVNSEFNAEKLSKYFHKIETKDESFRFEDLLDKLNEKLGITITCRPTKKQINNLLDAIHQEGIPIVLLTRCDICKLDDKKIIHNFFNFKPLGELYIDIIEKRKKAYAQKTKKEKEKHLGYNLAFIWEDPERLPPTIPLKQPGEYQGV